MKSGSNKKLSKVAQKVGVILLMNYIFDDGAYQEVQFVLSKIKSGLISISICLSRLMIQEVQGPAMRLRRNGGI